MASHYRYTKIYHRCAKTRVPRAGPANPVESHRSGGGYRMRNTFGHKGPPGRVRPQALGGGGGEAQGNTSMLSRIAERYRSYRFHSLAAT